MALRFYWLVLLFLVAQEAKADGLFDLVQTISDFFKNGIYQFFVDLFAYIVVWWHKLKLQGLIFMVQFSWDIAAQLMQDLNITGFLNSMYTHLDNQILNVMLYFRIPEALNTIINAYLTRYIFRFLGGQGIF